MQRPLLSLLIVMLRYITMLQSQSYLTQMGGASIRQLSSNSGISIAIVFDSTGSMGNELKQVKAGCRRLLKKHMKSGLENFITEYVLVKVHDPDVGPAQKTSSQRTFMRYLDSVFTQGGSDCPEMTVSGIELALKATKPNSLIYVFTDSSAKDYNKAKVVMDLIQKKQSQVVFVLTGYCNSTNDKGYTVYKDIATISSGQVFLLEKKDITEFMNIVETALKSGKVNILKEESSTKGSKFYSFPVDSHLSQITIQVTTDKKNETVDVVLRDPQGKIVNESNGLKRLLKNRKYVYFASKDQPLNGEWSLIVTTKSTKHSISITGTSEVNFIPGFSTNVVSSNYLTSRQPITDVENFVMSNITGNFAPGTMMWYHIIALNGTSIVRIPAEKSKISKVYTSKFPFKFDASTPFYVKISGEDSRGFSIQRYSKTAIIARKPKQVLVTCPRKISLKRGSTLKLTCLVNSEVPYSVKWLKRGPSKSTLVGQSATLYRKDANVTLVVKNVNEESQGIYVTEMLPISIKKLNLPGSKSDETIVSVLASPPIVQIPTDASVEPLKDAKLTCLVFSTSKADVKWFKEIPRFQLKSSKKFNIENQVKGKQIKSILTIRSASISDRGNYICEAMHEGGKNEAKAEVKIHTMPEVMVDTKEIFFQDNSKITADCQADGDPAPSINWMLNGKMLNPSTDTRVRVLNTLTSSSITIMNTKITDSGELTCVANNSAGIIQKPIKLVYTTRPTIISTELTEDSPLKGKSQTVKCIADGIPPPVISWEFNGSPVSSDGNIQIDKTTGMLTINKLDSNMKGSWSCVATNNAGDAKKEFILDVGESPNIVKFETNIKTNYGQQVELECKVTGTPPPKVSWLRGIQNGKFIPIALGNRFFLRNDNSLLIKGVTTKDQTAYKCIATNMHGKTEKVVNIEITGVVTPKIAYTKSKQTVLEGSFEKTLMCIILEAKPPAKITWLKDGKNIIRSSRVYTSKNQLIIKNVKTEDEGIYTCVAKNQVGVDKSNINLDVQTIPTIVGDPKISITMEEGSKMTLECKTKGDPNPEVEWRKDGQLISQQGSLFSVSDDGQRLEVNEAFEEHSGTYTCTASNQHASAAKEFNVNILIHPEIEPPPRKFEVGAETFVELNCLVRKGNPTPTIEWWKDGKPIVNIPGRVEVTNRKNILRVYGKNKEEAASYECRAKNKVGTAREFFQVTVLVPPKSKYTKLKRVYTKEGEKITLLCDIEGYPKPKKSWSWKSQMIDLDNNVLGLSRESKDSDDLVINNMREDQQGVYVCEGINAGGRAKLMYEVIILEPPKIIKFDDKHNFLYGNTITLQCTATGNPKPQIKWLFRGKLIPPNSSGYNILGKNDETLIVDRAISKNGGTYTCVAENFGGEDKKDSIVYIMNPLNKKEKEKISNMTQTVNGGNITFTCVMNSTPPADIKWFKDNVDIFRSLPRSRFYISPDGSTLTLFNVSSKDDGKFKCIAVNMPSKWGMNFTLQVLLSPKILNSKSSDDVINTQQETDLYIRCWAEGSPQPKYRWFRNNSEIMSGGRIRIQENGRILNIKNIRRNENAIYQCLAYNDAGKDNKTFTVNIYLGPKIFGNSSRETPEFIRGQANEIWCNYTGHPKPVITWEFDPSGSDPAKLNGNRRLYFNPTSKINIRRYTCVVTNEVGVVRKVFDPILIYPPIINPRDTTTEKWINPKGIMRLSCSNEAAPRAKVEWLKNGESISNHPRINITNDGTMLTLFQSDETDAGIYKCIVTNKLGQDKFQWSVKIKEKPKIRYSTPGNKMSVSLGNDLSLFCIPQGRPKPVLKWYKDGVELDSNSLPTTLRNRITFIAKNSDSKENYHLGIKESTVKEAGRYKCMATNDYGTAEKNFDVEITYGPKLDPIGKRQTTIKRTLDGSALLKCLVSGNPRPKITWYRNGIPLSQLRQFRYNIMDKGRQLEINPIKNEDNARFSCVAKNKFGSREITIDVSVGSAPVINREGIQQVYIVKEGDDLKLPCPNTGSPKPDMTFYRQNKKLITTDFREKVNNLSGKWAGQNIRNRASINRGTQTLTVYTFKRTDAGLYRCNASNANGHDVVEYQINVQSPPKFDTSNVQPEVKWFINQTRSLECILMGVADPPAAIVWERHGSPITSGNNIKISPDGKRLTVEKVQQYDAGKYRCFAQNKVGKVALDFDVLVLVQPRFIDDKRLIVRDVIQNRTIQLSCEATGQPRPRFTWYKRGKELLLGNQATYSNLAIIRNEQILQISNIQYMNADKYACTATNGGGTIEKQFKINVILPPIIVKRQVGIEQYKQTESRTVRFNCLVSNYNTTNPIMTWYKDGSPILLTDTNFYLTENNAQSLTVLNPTTAEAGLYKCEAKNKAGQDSHRFKLTVISKPKFPPNFNRFIERITVQRGQRVTLNCPATGSPQPNIVWSYNNERIIPYEQAKYSFSSNMQVLSIISMNESGGRFSCIATNEAGQTSKVYEVEVTMPPLVRLDKNDIRAKAGKQFSILCTAKGYPKPKIQWTRQNQGIFRLGTSANPKTGLLTISNAQKGDSGRYTCTARNKVGNDSKTIDIVIISPPRIQQVPRPIEASIDQQVRLPCVITGGTPPFRTSWFVPQITSTGERLIKDSVMGEYRVIPMEGLVIERVTKENAGIYRCTVRNEAGYEESRMQLKVMIKPRIMRPPNLVKVGIENDMLQVECQVIEGTPTPKLEWVRNGQRLGNSRNYYTITDSGKFIFNLLKTEDEGSLTCVAKNSAGVDQVQYNIVVEVPPRVKLPRNIEGREGSSIIIKCEVEGKPKPEITWDVENKPLSAILGSRYRLEQPHILNIFNLKATDAKSYTCRGKRKGFSVKAKTRLTVLTQPQFTQKPNKTIVLEEGRYITLKCFVKGNPMPSLQWMRNNEIISTKKHYRGRHRFHLGPVQSSDAGEYRCVAKNIIETITYRFKVEIIAKPVVTVYQSDDPTAAANKKTRLVCKTKGRIDSVVWLKNGVRIQNSTRMIMEGSNLIIYDTKAHDTGTYQCIASNKAGEAHGKVQLMVKTTPKIILKPTNTSTSLGDILILDCEAEGYPFPKIRWYKGGRMINGDHSHSIIRNGSLRIIGVQKEHEGFYFCQASNFEGDDTSRQIYVSVQIPGGWSGWSQWSLCSRSCGNGVMTRMRTCDNPSPSNGGRNCIGPESESRNCMERFCPSDGSWSNWEPWGPCSSSCGPAMKERIRRCDDPPPSNFGKTCPGKATEERFCENNPKCPINGQWSFWSPWTQCSVSCGAGGSQRRQRECNNPKPQNGGSNCDGKEVEVRACSRAPCPIHGGWSKWTQWTFCTKSCGSGIKQRSRFCNNPTPQFGGRQCSGVPVEKKLCQQTLCPVNGGWSNWASWDICSVNCGGGIQQRDRTCTEPTPSKDGRWCQGMGKEIRKCNEEECTSIDKTGGNNGWSKWSNWTMCSETTCLKIRRRKCLLSSLKCHGLSVETAQCLDTSRCKEISSNFNSMGEVRGTLNGESVGVVLINGTWDSKNMKKTQFNFKYSKIKDKHMNCFKILTGLLTPTIWNYAYQVGSASNGENFTKGNFLMDTLVQFDDGRTIKLQHNFFTRNNQPKFLTEVSGKCPISIENQDSQIDVSVNRYKVTTTQLNPESGKLNFDSSRIFRVNGIIQPYQWTSNITVTRGTRQKFIVQQLHVQDIKLNPQLPEKGGLNVELSGLIAEHDDSSTCPDGFQNVFGEKYCKDINECKRPEFNTCDQLCENTIPRFKCNCRKGYRLGLNGKSCIDIDECKLNKEQMNQNTGMNVRPLCDQDQECINIPGGYRCQLKCPLGFTRTDDGICQDIDECMIQKGICGIHACLNTHGSYYCRCKHGFKQTGNTCVDINECEQNLCRPHQSCTNTIGSYQCVDKCKSGFKISNSSSTTCEDIDECALGLAQCPFGARCHNSPGSYSCNCDPGFVQSQDDNGACMDIDECKLSSNLCKYGCRNLYGSYECICPSNMKQADDKKSCIDSNSLCKPGFQWFAKEGCVDVNECSNSTRNPCQYKCMNTYGSYWCKCPKGYSQSPKDFRKCVDINECSTDSRYLCQDHEMCINSPGSYSCVKPQCPGGYQFQKIRKACIKCTNSTRSKKQCTQVKGSKTIRYIFVEMSGINGRPIEVRVINTANEKEKNCEYRKLSGSNNLPINYQQTKDGSIVLTPKWIKYNVDIFNRQPYFMFFNVNCYLSEKKNTKIFQNQFYIYITLSKYPF